MAQNGDTAQSRSRVGLGLKFDLENPNGGTMKVRRLSCFTISC